MHDVDEIRATLIRLGEMLTGRNPGFADEFAGDALLIGSEPGERAEGREAIRALVAGLFTRPARIAWEWRTVDIMVDKQVGWVFAEGDLVLSDAAGRKILPYRMSGVLVREGNNWRWRLFHGSEPKVYEANP